MKTILVTTDFSDAARNASAYALEYAKEFGYKILLLHVYHFPVISVPEEPLMVLEDPKLIRKNNLDNLQEEATWLSKNSGVEIECKVCEGFAVDEILSIQEEMAPAMVIMGMQTEAALSEFIIGSIATDVVRKSKTPVLLIPANATYQKIDKIALAYDYNVKQDLHVLEPLKNMVKSCNAQFYVLNVGKKLEIEEDAEKTIAGIKLENYFLGTEFIPHFSENNDFAAGVKDFVTTMNIKILAMIPHKHNFLTRLFKEGHTKKIAFHTTIPLLTLPDHQN